MCHSESTYILLEYCQRHDVPKKKNGGEKTMKKILATLLVLAMVLAIVPAVMAEAPAPITVTVFKVDPGASEESGKIMKEQSKTNFLPVLTGEQHFSLLLFKDPIAQHFLSGDDLFAHLFILRKPADETEDQERIPLICKTPVHHMP